MLPCRKPTGANVPGQTNPVNHEWVRERRDGRGKREKETNIIANFFFFFLINELNEHLSESEAETKVKKQINKTKKKGKFRKWCMNVL